ncbi:MAG: hypothetical protein NTX70_11670 [Verrucomicrobia bacterium]|nr:hypothetical protein [Verrucomicrobiota bacterium]
MNLHQLFLADLGPELQLTAETLRQASFAVRRNRNEWLLRQRTHAIIEMIAHTADQWLEPENGFRLLALRDGPRETGWSPATLARGLDTFFRSITVESLEALVAQDLGDASRLDDFGAGSAEHRTGRTSLAVGPELLVHLTDGNLPNPALFSMILGLITRSAQIVKCPTRCCLGSSPIRWPPPRPPPAATACWPRCAPAFPPAPASSATGIA